MKISSSAFIVLLICQLALAPAFSQTQQEMNIAEEDRFQKADQELNIEYGKLMKAVEDTGKEKLKKAQRAWIAYRDAETEFATDDCQGGTMEPMIRFATMANLTEARVKELKASLEMYQR